MDDSHCRDAVYRCIYIAGNSVLMRHSRSVRKLRLLKKLQMRGRTPENDAGVVVVYVEEAEGREQRRWTFATVSNQKPEAYLRWLSRRCQQYPPHFGWLGRQVSRAGDGEMKF